MVEPLLDFKNTGEFLTGIGAPGSDPVYCMVALSSYHADLQEAHKVTGTNSCWCAGCSMHSSQFGRCMPPSSQPINDDSVGSSMKHHGFEVPGQSAAEAASTSTHPLRTPEDALAKVSEARTIMHTHAATMGKKKEYLKKAEDFLSSFGLDLILLYIDNYFYLLPYCNIFIQCYPDRLHQIEKGTAPYMFMLIRAALADRTLLPAARFNRTIGDASQPVPVGGGAVFGPNLNPPMMDQRMHEALPQSNPAAPHLRITAADVIAATRSLSANTMRTGLSLSRGSIYDADIRIVRLVSAQVRLWRAIKRRYQTMATMCVDIPELVYELQRAFAAFREYSPSQLDFPKFHRLVHIAVGGLYFGRLQTHTTEPMERQHGDVKEALVKTNHNIGCEVFAGRQLNLMKSVDFAILEHERFVHCPRGPTPRTTSALLSNTTAAGPAAAVPAPLPPPPCARVVNPRSMATKAGSFKANLLSLLCSTKAEKCEERLGYVASADCAKHLLSCPEVESVGAEDRPWPQDKAHLRDSLRRPNKDIAPNSDLNLERWTLVLRLKDCLKRELNPAPEWLDPVKLKRFLDDEYMFLTSVYIYDKCKTPVLASPEEHEFLDPEQSESDGAGDSSDEEDAAEIWPEGGRFSLVQLVAKWNYKRRSPSSSHSGAAASRQTPRMDAVRIANYNFDSEAPASATNPPFYIAQLMLFLSIPSSVLQLLALQGKQAPTQNMLFTLHGTFRECEAPVSWQRVEEGQTASRASMLLPLMIARDIGPSNAQEKFEFCRYRVTPVSSILNPVMIIKSTYLVHAPQSVKKIPLYFLNIDVDC